MSSALERQAEIAKLARVLRREPAQLAYLERVPARDIRQLREQVVDMLFTAHGEALGRLAAASKLLPIGLISLIAQRAFGPVLSARIAGMLDPSRAVEVAEKLPADFLAEVAVNIDPRRARDVIGRVDPRRVAEISVALLRRDEYVTMGRFVGHLSREAIVAALEVTDDQSLLRVAFVLEEKERLNELIDVLPQGRRMEVIDVAASADLWTEALDLLAHLSQRRREALVAGVDPAQREILLRRARAAGVLDQLGPLLGTAISSGQ